jgi:hypothetical protein
MKAQVLLFCLALISAVRLCLAQNRPIDDLLMSLHNASRDELIAKVKSITANERIQALRELRRGPETRWGSPPAYLLSYLGDDDQRQRDIKRFLQIRFFYPELVDVGDPKVIVEVAPHLFREEKYQPVLMGHTLNEPLSYASAGLIIMNIRQSSIYSDEVLDWARSRNPYDLVPLRGEMRKWWQDNKQYYKRGEYKSVRPGREITAAAGKSVRTDPTGSSIAQDGARKSPQSPTDLEAEPSR